jgi:hypothetical protein
MLISLVLVGWSPVPLVLLLCLFLSQAANIPNLSALFSFATKFEKNS